MKIEGEPLEVFELPMPRRIVREDLVLPASYANFYIANNCVLLPTFADPMDEPARETLQKLFPGSQSDRDRLPRINLGPGHVSLPDPATAGGAVKENAPTLIPTSHVERDKAVLCVGRSAFNISSERGCQGESVS